MDFQQYVFGAPYFGWLCRGVLMTLLISGLTSVLASALALAALRAHTSPSRSTRACGWLYVAAFRNMPLVPLLLFLSFGLPGIWRQLTGMPLPGGCEFCMLIAALSLNTSAYLSEILNAGVRAIPAAQKDAARTLGLSESTIRWRVIYPQALRLVAPALASRLVHNMKNSSVALVLPLSVELMEVVGQAQRIAGQSFSWAEPLLFAAAVYLALALLLSRWLNRWALQAQHKAGLQR